MSWTRPSLLRGSGLTTGQSTKTLTATQLRRKGREKKQKTKKRKKKTNRQNPRTDGKSKPIQIKSHKEAYTYTLTIGERGKKYIQKKKEESNQINKQISQ